MPLREGCSQDIIQANISQLIEEGYPPGQAAAIAYSQCKNAYTPDEWKTILEGIGYGKSLGFRTRKGSPTGTFIKAIGVDNPDRFEAHLVRYAKSPGDTDLDDEWFDGSTWFKFDDGYPVIGRPVNYQHALDPEYGSFSMGIFDKQDEDDIGVFVEAQLHTRARYMDMLRELGRRKGIHIGDSQLKEKAEIGVTVNRELITQVPLQMSMGADPAVYAVNEKTGHIDTCGIIHGALTPTPADDKQPIVRFKSAMQYVTDLQNDRKTVIIGNVRTAKAEKPGKTSATTAILESATETQTPDNPVLSTEVGVDLSRFATILTDNLKSNINGEELSLMDREELLGKIRKQLEPVVDELLEQLGVEPEKQEDEEELLDEMLGKAEGDLPEDEEEIKQLEEEDVVELIRENAKNWLPEQIKKVLEEGVKVKAYNKSMASGIVEAYKASIPAQSKKSEKGGFRQGEDYRVNVTGKAEKPDLVNFIKSIYAPLRATLPVGKAQNPYIGTLGGSLLGEEMSTEILEMLRAKVVMFDAGVQQRTVSGIGVYTVPKMTTAPTAFRPGINTAVTASEGKFDTVTAFLRPIAAVVVIPRQLLLQTRTNVEDYIKNEMVRSIRLQVDKEILQGEGNVVDDTGAEIKGVYIVLAADGTLSGTNIVDLAANGRKPRFTDLTAAETQIATGNVEMDGETTKWIMHPRTRGTFRSLTTTTGEPLMNENYGASPYPDMIGYGVHTTTQIPVTDTQGTSSAASKIYFGNWRFGEYIMGNDIEFIVDEVSLANQLQIRITAYTYSDFIVHYGDAFYVMRGAIA